MQRTRNSESNKAHEEEFREQTVTMAQFTYEEFQLLFEEMVSK